MKTILQKLDITQDQYETLVWNFYRNWCDSVSISTIEFQQVLSNSAINRWFMLELQKCEAEFHSLTDRYTDSNVSAQDMEKCYKSCAFKLFNIRPMALLNHIVKPKTVKGIRIFNALTQN